MKRLTIISLLLSLVLLTACNTTSGDDAEHVGTAIGEKAPNFTLQTIDGEQVELASLEGKRVLLNFWATWCGPCREELPHMQSFYEGADKSIEMVAVNLTSQDYGKDKVTQFIDDYDMTFPVVLDALGDIAKRYEILTIPTTFILDEQGIILEKISGPLTEEQIKQYMQ